MNRRLNRSSGGKGQSPAVNTAMMGQLARQAMVAYQSGRLNECESICRRMLALDPGETNANLIIGILAFGAGQNKDAIGFFQTAIARDRKNADAHANLGLALAASGQPFEARASLQTAIHLNPKAIESYLNLSNIETRLGYTDNAVSHLMKASELQPRNLDIKIALGKAMIENNQTEDAIKQFQQVIAIDPDHSAGLYQLGIAHRNLGNFAEAENYMRKATQGKGIVSGLDVELDWMMGRLSDAEIDEILKAQSSIPEGTAERIHFDFALSKIEHNRGNYESAARHLRSANRLKRKKLTYDRDKDTREVEDMISTFNAEFFEQRDGYGCSDETPLFVVGMTRSGTSLVEQILASHPDVYGAGELRKLGLLKFRNREFGVPSATFPEFAASLTKSSSARLGQIYVDDIRGFDDKARFIVDKMPGNFLFIGLIRLILPNARIIHCTRDAREVCLSNFRTNFTDDNLPYTYDLDDLIHYYGLYRKLMDHWYSLFGDTIITVDHASMVRDSEGEIRKLLASCDLEFVPECLEFHKTKRSVQTASVTQVRQPIYDPTKRGWQKYAEYLPELHALDKYVTSG